MICSARLSGMPSKILLSLDFNAVTKVDASILFWGTAESLGLVGICTDKLSLEFTSTPSWIGLPESLLRNMWTN
jgi:hypothetical protein